MGADASKTGDAAAGTTVDAGAGTTVDTTGDAKDSSADTKDAKGTASNGEDTDGLKKALASERKRAEKAEKTLKDAELAKLPEIDRLNTENKDLNDQVEKLTKKNLKLEIAMDLELPWRIGKRIEGDTEEEMRSDAADLLKDYKASSNEDPKDRKRPANDAGKSGGSAAGTAVDMNRLLRAAAGKGGK
jgi:hypothetical protein